MNDDTLKGNAQEFGGMAKETTGTLVGDRSMQASGKADQVGGKAQQGYGAARDAVAPFADKARAFARQRPFAAAAVVGVVGMALLNTLRGR